MFPKFARKSKIEFKTWYDKVLAILAAPPWASVFQDLSTLTLKTDDNITVKLSAKLFSAIRQSLTGNAEQLTKKHAWGKGLLYLQILKDTYKEQLYQADLLKCENKFSNLFKKNNESIDNFAARCVDFRNQLSDHGITTSDQGFKNRFIMGLGPLFTEIQQVQEEDLLSHWRITDI